MRLYQSQRCSISTATARANAATGTAPFRKVTMGDTE